MSDNSRIYTRLFLEDFVGVRYGLFLITLRSGEKIVAQCSIDSGWIRAVNCKKIVDVDKDTIKVEHCKKQMIHESEISDMKLI